MADILHRIGATASPDAVYTALTTIDGLSGWWTEKTTRAGDDVIRFRFDLPQGEDGFDMKVLETVPGKLVHWEVVAGPEEWIGTHVRFELKQQDDYTVVLFRHEGWKEPVEFMYHCSTKWATFLLSLKELVETGTGRPAPNDVRISNWH
ncbi:SRPBCC family protein [Jiangella rhizosphaerae]|uniref:SRPBCC domain-containing protein n=1 Tax=Jiangella rhizosphaerae TaxID=2293569 RepID=A0A418KV36_9ACTN|nr:SRPBCC domain-containing protein [Jiangella rhizosphaerae]RIQ32554.1 SRPBCC domain-containing protein [Jiangella rhizosphaerae]